MNNEIMKKILETSTTEFSYDEIQATCTKEGRTGGSYCGLCGQRLEEPTVVPVNDRHTKIVLDNAVPSTCTTDGKTEGKHCSRCNTTLVAQTTVAALNHVEVIEVR